MPRIPPPQDPPASLQAAVEALGDLGARGAASEIAKLLEDTEWPVRAVAVAALGKLGAKVYALEIVKLLKEPPRSTAASVLRVRPALFYFTPPYLYRYLCARLRDPGFAPRLFELERRRVDASAARALGMRLVAGRRPS